MADDTVSADGRRVRSVGWTDESTPVSAGPLMGNGRAPGIGPWLARKLLPHAET